MCWYPWKWKQSSMCTFTHDDLKPLQKTGQENNGTRMFLIQWTQYPTNLGKSLLYKLTKKMYWVLWKAKLTSHGTTIGWGGKASRCRASGMGSRLWRGNSPLEEARSFSLPNLPWPHTPPKWSYACQKDMSMNGEEAESWCYRHTVLTQLLGRTWAGHITKTEPFVHVYSWIGKHSSTLIERQSAEHGVQQMLEHLP